MSKILKKIAPIALPILGTMIAPRVGTALGSSLSGAALGGIGGALGGAAGGVVGGGGLKSAALGAALGGLGGYTSAGGNILGTAAKAKVGGMAGGSGILGALTKGGSSLGNTAANTISSIGRIGGSTMAKGSSGGIMGAMTGAGRGTLGTLASGVMQYGAQDDAEEELRRSQEQALARLSPYEQRFSEGFNPGDLSQDPGYQFRLQEGQKQLEQSLAARGMGQSGAALKAAQEYGQNFANQEYNDAYQRWLSQNQAGANVASGVGDIYSNMGEIGAGGVMGKNNALAGTLGNLFGSNIKGWDANGNPIYG